MRRLSQFVPVAAVLLLLAAAPAPAAEPVPSETVEARKHFFGSENVAADGSLPAGRVILSWFSVGSFAVALDGHVVLFDSYIHKGEDRPGYVPTTTAELLALRSEAIFLGHGHFDHAKNAGVIAARTGAVLVGTPEHCDQARTEAADAGVDGGAMAVRCVDAVSRGSQPGAELNNLAVLGPSIAIQVLKHVHSAAEPPDGEDHESSLDSPPPVDSGSILLHPPGPSVIGGLNPSGDEGGTLLYRFQLGEFSLIWHDSAGPLREEAPALFDTLRALPPTDVEVGAVLGFNEPTNGVRDPVDYIAALKPKVFVPNHHDFVSEYGSGRNFEGAIQRELAKRGPVVTDLRWISDPFDYLRPSLMTYDTGSARWADGGVAPAAAPRECLPHRARTSGRRSIGLLSVGLTRTQLARRISTRPLRSDERGVAWCIRGAKGRMTATFATPDPAARATLVATTSPSHRTRGVGTGSSVRALRRAFPRARRVTAGAVVGFPGSHRVFAIARGRVRAVAVAGSALLGDRRSLRADLREATAAG
jgi:hypothetical protein